MVDREIPVEISRDLRGDYSSISHYDNGLKRKTNSRVLCALLLSRDTGAGATIVGSPLAKFTCEIDQIDGSNLETLMATEGAETIISERVELARSYLISF